MTPDRRTFLRTTGAALSAAAVGACAPGEGTPGAGDGVGADPARSLDPALLRTVAALVLPSELGEAGREQAVQGFERWAYAFEPVAELNHGYGTSEIRYGPPDPLPGWAAQLRGLEAEARRRFDSGYDAIDSSRRDAILRRQIEEDGAGMPSPLRARHVAVALMAWWLETPEATDRCYGVRIAPQTCRGIENAPEQPEPVA